MRSGWYDLRMSAGDMQNRSVGGTVAGSPRSNRLEAAGILLVVIVVLGLSWWLTPSEAGHGTHRQLLLIPCGFHWLISLPCPMCGMTTAFALIARGEVLAAFGAHVTGPALFLATVVAGVRAGYALVLGVRPLPRWALSATAARWFIALLLVGWGINVLFAFVA